MNLEEPFGLEALRKRLDELPSVAQLAFLLSCAERLFPNYVAFIRRHDWGNSAVLERALEIGWTVLAGKEIERPEIADALAGCEGAIPNTELFNSELVSPALNAAACSCLLLEFLVEPSSHKVLEAATLARDTVDMYVQDVEPFLSSDPSLEKRILNHTFMRREIERQRTDLEMLTQVDWGHPESVARLVDRWRNPQVSNIGQSRLG